MSHYVDAESPLVTSKTSGPGTVSPELLSSALSFIRKHPLTSFLALAYLLGWSMQWVAAKAGLPQFVQQSMGAAIGLAAPAFFVAWAVGGAEGARDLLGRMFRWRVGLLWYVSASLGLVVISVAITLVLDGGRPIMMLAETWPLFFSQFLPSLMLTLIGVQIFEELAWTGFAQHRLQERHGPVLASIMVAPAFGFIHLMGNYLGTDSLSAALTAVAIQIVFSLFFRVGLTWFYNGAGQSVLIAALFHAALNAGNGPFLTGLLGESYASWVPVAGVALGAIVVAFLTRGKLGTRTRGLVVQQPGTQAPPPSIDLRGPFHPSRSSSGTVQVGRVTTQTGVVLQQSRIVTRWIAFGTLGLPLFGLLTFWSSLNPQPDPSTRYEEWSKFVTTNEYVLSHVLGSGLGLIFAIFGTFALGTYLARGRSPNLGLISTGVAALGSSLFLMVMGVSAFAAPEEGQAFLSGIQGLDQLPGSFAHGVFEITFLVAILLNLVGNVLMGVAIWRSELLPRWAGLLWASAPVLMYVLGIFYAAIIGIRSTPPTVPVGAFLAAVGGTWIAWHIFRAERSPRRPVRRIESEDDDLSARS